MADITLGGTPATTIGDLPKTGTKAPNFTLTKTDMSLASLNDFAGKNVILNIFPSVDTGVCAASVRKFNEEASKLDNTVVLCISRDLPFAQARFCGAEGLDNVVTLSDFADGSFGNAYGVKINDGAFANLHARAIVIVGTDGNVAYTELVKEVGDAVNFDAALAAL